MSPRIVIYPLFGAGHDETVELCEKLADVMLAHHGPSSGDEIKSFIVFENADDLPEDPEELVKGAIEDAALVILVGAEDEETERDKEPFA